MCSSRANTPEMTRHLASNALCAGALPHVFRVERVRTFAPR